MIDLPASHKEHLPLQTLGHVRVGTFLREYWQKKPLLIRGAFPPHQRFAPLTVPEIRKLASYDEAESRLITLDGESWNLEHGPFSSRALHARTRKEGVKYSLLIQDTQHYSHEAQALLAAFSFLPDARVDDLMVSLANSGGGVGPHVDSYDVFLLQGNGQREWQISSQRDVSIHDGLPLKILQRFRATQKWTLETGDMLYLPPGVAHHGIAKSDDCVTWSIGFRAPSHREILEFVLERAHDVLLGADGPTTLRDRQLDRRFSDAGRKPVSARAEVELTMLESYRRGVLPDLSMLTSPTFLHDAFGRYLTLPKPNVSFIPPVPMRSLQRFAKRAAQVGLALDLRSRMLYRGTTFWLNGEAIKRPPRAPSTFVRALTALANDRRLPPAKSAAMAHVLYPYWCTGELQLNDS
jgi:50S ribosomal protein L16 3-hydroxylase